MIKTILLDIDNTLYDYDDAHKKAMEHIYTYCKERLKWEKEKTKRLIQEAKKEQESRFKIPCSAMHNRLIRFQILLEKEEKPIDPYAMELYQCYWKSLIYYANIQPGAYEFLQWAKHQHIRIGIATDMTAHIQYQKLKKLKVLSMIDFLVTSEEAGEEKPGRTFFSLCLKKAKCRPEECVMIGDSLKKDVEGAMALGMQALWYCPKREDAEGKSRILQSFFECQSMLKVL